MKKLLITLLAIMALMLPAHAEWDDHVLMENKGYGGCTVLTGDVRLVVVMVDVQGQEWDAHQRLQMMQAVQQGMSLLETEAAGYGIALDLIPEWHEATATFSVGMDVAEDWADAVLASVEGLHGRTDALYAETPIVFCLSSAGRAFAHTEWLRSEAEFAFLFAGDDEATLRHELLHLFGAEDFYVQEDIKSAAASLCPDSIMLDGLTDDRVDSLTAYLIGWTEEPDAMASEFLSLTSHVTTEMFDAAREEDQLSGYQIITWENGTYAGMMADGFEHGWGEFRWTNGDVYAGAWEWGEPHGRGTYAWADGTTYTGDYVHGERTGKGVMTWPDGTCYTGDFVDDACHGRGVMTFPDGLVYTGDFVMDERTGQGTYVWPDGTIYTGGVKNGMFHGKGAFDWPNGQSYTGDFAEDQMSSGQAVMIWPDGTTYTGEVVDGVVTGKGTFARPDGSVYVGGVVRGWKEGEGLWLMADGTMYLGDFLNDIRYGEGLQINPDGSIYRGEFISGYFHGAGTLTGADGSIYTGGFYCNLFHGEGAYRDAEGNVVKGAWVFGELQE